MGKQKKILRGFLFAVLFISLSFIVNCRELRAGQLIVCEPIEIEICSICGNDYRDGNMCPHHKGEIYNGTVCSPYESDICTICHGDYSDCSHIGGEVYGGTVCDTYRQCDICGNNYDDGSVCPHHEGESYGGEECTTYIVRICNMCGSDYTNGDLCPHQQGAVYEEGLCEPFDRRICSICGNNYDDGNVCPHHEGEYYDTEICTITRICKICGNDYDNADVCPHRIGERYGGTLCESYTGRICNICGFDYDDGNWCPHQEDEIYNGQECTTSTTKICNICGYNYYDAGVCPHKDGTLYDLGLFEEGDFDLNPEVQQMISYYDDLYTYSTSAYEMGLIIYDEDRVLKNVCREKVQELRQNNAIDLEDDDYIFDAVLFVGGFLPYVGTVCDILSDPMVVQAATLDTSAITKINSNLEQIIDNVAKKSIYRHTVYELVDEYGNVKYVGRTRQQLKVREMQHHRADPDKKDLRIRVAKINEIKLENLNYWQVRGLEHEMFEYHGGISAIKSGKLLNKIRPLDLKKGKAQEYIEAALRFLNKIN